MNHKTVMCAALLLSACAPALRQSPDQPPPVAREFRGIWVASVSNIDWPSRRGLPADSQKNELLAILDRARALRMNAVILQVRPAADALYASTLEPWSEYLTGKQGTPPDPYYDPLEFAVQEAHRRGLELHAWFNPYRARHPSARGEQAASHLSNTRPDIVHRYGRSLWMDPGEPDVQQQTLNVVLDVVKRYDVDGVHLDDYFYPYQERDSAGSLIPFPDDASYRRYVEHGGKLQRDDWRRANVDHLIEGLYREIKQAKPWVKFGISPFGIWRPGYPAEVKGFDAYATLYADSRKWLERGWIDYWTPQLYWQISAADHSYTSLLRWWIGENTHHRHVWVGNGSFLVGRNREPWPVSEVIAQIAATRAQPGASGNIHFSMRTFLRNQASINDALLAQSYTYFALPPRSAWLDDKAPPAPSAQFDAASRVVRISAGAGELPMWFAVRLRVNGTWYAEVIPAGQTVYPVLPGLNVLPDSIVITAVDRNGNESRTQAVTSNQ